MASKPDKASAHPNHDDVLVVKVRPYASHPLDIYPLTVTFDALCLIYLVFTYQALVKSDTNTVGVDFAEALNQEQFPLYYLNAIAITFALILFDRVSYVLRDHRFKAAHLLLSSLLFVGAMLWITWFSHRDSYTASTTTKSKNFHADRAGDDSPVRPLGPAPIDSDPTPIWLTRRWLVLLWIAPLRIFGQMLHALQLRMGYPSTTAGHYLTRNDGSKWYWNTLWALYRAIPFLYEMRTILDWSCSSTALTLREWLKLEDIYASLFTAKCLAIYNKMRKKGRPQPWWKKLFLGFGAFALLIVVLWAPLYIFSTGNPTVLSNPVQALQVNVTLERAHSAYSAGGLPRNRTVEQDRWRLYEAGYSRRWVAPFGTNVAVDPPSLAGFTMDQLQVMCVPKDSDVDWPISPPNIAALMSFLNLALTGDPAPQVLLTYGWTFVRNRPATNRIVTLTHSLALQRFEVQELLMAIEDIHNGTATSRADGQRLRAVRNYTVPFLPATDSAFVRLPGEGAPLTVEPARRASSSGYCNLTLSSYGGGARHEVWSLACHTPSEGGGAAFDVCPEPGPAIVAASDKVLGGLLASALTGFGLTGLYVTFVFGVGRFLRLTVANLRVYIPFEDLPDVTRIVTLIEGIYAARAERLFALEEELYGALIRLYRSPELLIAATEGNPAEQTHPKDA